MPLEVWDEVVIILADLRPYRLVLARSLTNLDRARSAVAFGCDQENFQCPPH